MKLAFLTTLTLAALALARPIEDGTSDSSDTADEGANDSYTALDDGGFSSFVATSAASAPVADSSTTAYIDLSKVNGVTSGSVTKFLGITYATAGRFKQATPVSLYFGSVNATAYGPSCPAQAVSRPSATRRGLESSEMWSNLHRRNTGEVEAEDCLTLNIIRPSNVKSTDKLPVLVWIFGGKSMSSSRSNTSELTVDLGGFEAGSTLQYDALGTRIVTRSVALGTPVIHVAMNYRVSAFGFLASKEVQAEGLGNFGLNDQRVALRWVAKYIKGFGGDPTTVTIWGQSAGAISVSLQMLAFGGKNEGLFRGAFMQSGAPIPVGKMTDVNGQAHYDQLVADTGCTNASCGTLECLRTVPLATLQAAINKSPSYLSFQGLHLSWGPRVDGTFLTDFPYNSLKQGKVVNIPFVTGNVDDEGTLFSSAQTNVSTDADFKSYIKSVWLPKAQDPELAPLWTAYPDDQTKGSPFDTGSSNQVYGQYKRIAAFQGDTAFQSPRRYFQQKLAGKMKMWTYLSKKLKTASSFGSYHGSDIDTALLDDYVINFTVYLNPNGATGNAWPQYSTASPNVYTFTDTAAPAAIPDTFRVDGFSALVTLSTKYPS